jgi:hypothetical protein
MIRRHGTLVAEEDPRPVPGDALAERREREARVRRAGGLPSGQAEEEAAAIPHGLGGGVDDQMRGGFGQRGRVSAHRQVGVRCHG